MSHRGRNWCFTLNNYTEEDVDRLSNLPDTVSYCIFGREVGESGTPHLQGFVQFSDRVRITQVKQFVGATAHVEFARNVPAAIEYCKKEGNFREFGQICGSAGKRNDLDEFKEAVKGGNLKLSVLREDHSEVFAKYPRFCLEYIQDHYPQKVVEEYPLRPWQQELKNMLDQEPDDRKIIFVVDYAGNNGKSWFAQYFCQCNENAQLILPGKVADMTYSLRQDIRVLFCDAPRSKQGEFLQYDLFEHVKNGHIFSGKYESRVKTFGKVHVVVMMNERPDMTKLSLDRYQIITLDGGEDLNFRP